MRAAIDTPETGKTGEPIMGEYERLRRLVIDDAWGWKPPIDDVYDAACVLNDAQKAALFDAAIATIQKAGYELMPRDETDEMLRAAFHSQQAATTGVCSIIYAAMVNSGAVRERK